MGRTISSQDTPLDIPTPTTLLPTQKLVLVSNIWNQDMFAVLQMPLDSLQERRLYSLLWFFIFIYLLCAYMGARVHMRRSQDNLQVLALLPPSGAWESNSGHHDCWQEPLLSGTACKLYFLCWLFFFLKQHVTGWPICFKPVIVSLPLGGLLGRAWFLSYSWNLPLWESQDFSSLVDRACRCT